MKNKTVFILASSALLLGGGIWWLLRRKNQRDAARAAGEPEPTKTIIEKVIYGSETKPATETKPVGLKIGDSAYGFGSSINVYYPKVGDVIDVKGKNEYVGKIKGEQNVNGVDYWILIGDRFVNKGLVKPK